MIPGISELPATVISLEATLPHANCFCLLFYVCGRKKERSGLAGDKMLSVHCPQGKTEDQELSG